MPCASCTSIDVEYDEVLCELHALQLIHNAMYVIFGGDLNTDLIIIINEAYTPRI